MAYYDALIAKWATITPGTTAAKLIQINAATIAGPAVAMVVTGRSDCRKLREMVI